MVACLPWKQEVAGSSPAALTIAYGDTSMIDDTQASRVRAFVAASALASADGNCKFGPRAWQGALYGELSNEGWLIELGRAYLRLLISPRTLSHAEFATWLGLTGADAARDYRRVLITPEPPRGELVRCARRWLRVEESARFESLRASTEHQRFKRTYAAWAKQHAAKGGRPAAPMHTFGPLGAQLEKLRGELGIEPWAARLGISPITYRRWLEDEDKPRVRTKLADLAQSATRAHDAFELDALARDAEARSVTSDELGRAYETTWTALDALRAQLLDETPVMAQDPPSKVEPAAPTAFPSNDADGFLRLDLYTDASSWGQVGQLEIES